MKFRLSPVVFVTLIFCATSLFGQSWSGVLDSSRAIDWSQAGSAHINDVRTQCVTSQCATVSGGTVTVASINAALASAPANTYVLIPAGTFTMSAGLTFAGRSNITLRGSGSNSTFLVWSGSSGSGDCNGHDICAASTDVNYSGGPSNTANWIGTNGVSGTYTKGATSIILSSVTSLAVGDPIILDQIDDAADTGGLWIGCEVQNSRCGNDGPGGYQRGSGGSSVRGQQQYVNVTSISGSGPYTVGITPGIYMNNWRTSQSPGAWWASNPVFNDGVETISLDHSHGGDGITFFNCTGCWVKGIRSISTTAGGTGWYHLGFANCNHCTAQDSYHYGYQGDDYGFGNYGGSDNLWENNIGQYPSEDFMTASDCEGCVSAYNFTANPYYGNSTAWLSPDAYFHALNMLTLLEGNIGSGVYADGYHGAHALNTIFRNRFDGREQNNGALTSGNTAAVQLAPGARYHNIIGNVLGTVGYHAHYVATPSNDVNWNAVISAGLFEGTGGTDTLPYPTSMWWGNWDVATNAVRWCGNSNDSGWSTTCAGKSEVPSAGLPNGNAYANPIPASEALPASFYLDAKPSWWPAGKAWPPIGPEVTGGTVGQCVSGSMQSSSCSANSQCPGSSCSAIAGGKVVSTPAMDCYFNKMGGVANGTGPALSFDASACYSSSGGGGGGGGSVAPPSGLSAVVQ